MTAVAAFETPARRIVVATADVLAPRMAGPAIRALHFAEALAGDGHTVTLVTTATCTLAADSFDVRAVDARGVADLLAVSDVWIVQGSVLQEFPAIGASDVVVVADLYDPYHLENLENSRGRSPRDRQAMVHNATAVLNRVMQRGDAFLVASGKQRDFWLGALASLGRVNPLTYDADPDLAHLVREVPFGISPVPPTRGEPALRGVTPGIGADDVVLLWGGGLYNWFDPETLVRAVDVVRRTRDDVRLVFLGAGHPNPLMPTQATAVRTRELADGLGLTDRHVFFNSGWVPYDERGRWFAEADIGVSTHLDHVETAFSFRTRLLDYLWAGLPIVATDGDVFAPAIVDEGLGAVVPAGDVDALAAALLHLIQDDDARTAAGAAAARYGERFRWATALAPLVQLCRTVQRAPDLLDADARAGIADPFTTVRAPLPGPPGWRGEVALARQYLRRGGYGLLARRVVTRAGKLVRGRR